MGIVIRIRLKAKDIANSWAGVYIVRIMQNHKCKTYLCKHETCYSGMQ